MKTNRSVVQQQDNGSNSITTTVSIWARRMKDEICFSDEYTAIPEEEKQNYLIKKGYPTELFKEPLSFLFASEVGKAVVEQYIQDIYEVTVLQTVKEENKSGMFVQFMRGLTWSSFEKYMKTNYRFLGVSGIINQVVLGKKPPTFPFWFRNFCKPPVKAHVLKTLDRISSSLIKADYFLLQYKKTKETNVKQEEQYLTGAEG